MNRESFCPYIVGHSTFAAKHTLSCARQPLCFAYEPQERSKSTLAGAAAIGGKTPEIVVVGNAAKVSFSSRFTVERGTSKPTRGRGHGSRQKRKRMPAGSGTVKFSIQPLHLPTVRGVLHSPQNRNEIRKGMLDMPSDSVKSACYINMLALHRSVVGCEEAHCRTSTVWQQARGPDALCRATTPPSSARLQDP